MQVFDCYCAVCLFIFAAKARSDLKPAASSQKSVVPPSLVIPQRPEEDILFQWRLRRKMEQAREGPRHVHHPSFHGLTFSWQSQTFNHPAANGPPFKVILVLCCRHVLLCIPVCRIIHFFLISYIVYSTSRVPKLNTQHIHT